MSESLVLLAICPTVGGSLRGEAIEKLSKTAKIAQDNEPTVTKYAICTPRDDDGKTVYIIQEFANKEAMTAQRHNDAAKNVGEWAVENDALDPDVSMSVHILQSLPAVGPRILRAPLQNHADPHIALFEIDYTPGGVDVAAPKLAAVLDSARDAEPGTLLFDVLRDTTAQRADTLFLLEAYESGEYLQNVHEANPAVQEVGKATQEVRTRVKQHVLKKVAGYLHKEA